MSTAAKLRERRTSLGLTQESVAHRADMSTVQYNGYERGRHEPSPSTMARLARALNTAADKLWGDKEISEDVGTIESLRDALRRRVAKETNWNPDRVRVTIRLE